MDKYELMVPYHDLISGSPIIQRMVEKHSSSAANVHLLPYLLKTKYFLAKKKWSFDVLFHNTTEIINNRRRERLWSSNITYCTRNPILPLNQGFTTKCSTSRTILDRTPGCANGNSNQC